MSYKQSQLCSTSPILRYSQDIHSISCICASVACSGQRQRPTGRVNITIDAKISKANAIKQWGRHFTWHTLYSQLHTWIKCSMTIVAFLLTLLRLLAKWMKEARRGPKAVTSCSLSFWNALFHRAFRRADSSGSKISVAKTLLIIIWRRRLNSEKSVQIVSRRALKPSSIKIDHAMSTEFCSATLFLLYLSANSGSSLMRMLLGTPRWSAQKDCSKNMLVAQTTVLLERQTW